MSSRILLPGSLRPGRANSNLPIPAPRDIPLTVPIFRVTEFRDYLACPYRYYLRHRLKLEALGDSAQELNAGQFGSLLHEALMDFGRSELRDSTNPDEIRDSLFVALGELAAARFGVAAQPAVQVQIELLKLRLRAFAEQQARRRAEGWRIVHVEKEFGERDGNERPAEFPVDGQPALLTGRVDRIDRHEATGVWAVLDYKSSEKAEDPAKTHRKGDDWVDLQLPLYRHLVRELNVTGDVKLGYIQLPKDTTKTAFKMADWTEDDLRRADETARDVVRKIRDGLFWPPAAQPPAFNEDFAAICQDGRLGAVADSDAEEADE
jgi:ATP-dependent helicase/DNAse subunit B